MKMELKMYKVIELTLSEREVYVAKDRYKKEYRVGSEGSWKITKDVDEVIEIVNKEKEMFLNANKNYRQVEILKDEIGEFFAQIKDIDRDGEVFKSIYCLKVVEIDMPIK